MFLTPYYIAAIATVALISVYLSFQEQTKMTPKPKLNVHSFPRPPLLEKTPRHLVIKWGSNGNETTVADTRDAYWALETTHPPSMNCHSSTYPADFLIFSYSLCYVPSATVPVLIASQHITYHDHHFPPLSR
jgi:hypothetical protein